MPYSVCKVLLVYVLCFSDIKLTNSKRIHIPNHEGIIPKKLNECSRCKLLTDSVNHWLDKTSRGKYEGGDTAWEEAKLKSYSRSEVRLVEVQEGLCSELSSNQDECYIIAEEAELAIEKWWFHEDPNAVDLHTWLCIETLKHCCPLNHFGELCTPCPVNKNNKVCSGHGKCDGEGTRLGNGSCLCESGFTGVNCNECAKNFYESDDSCKMCHKSCDGCNSGGPSGCHGCKSGWKLDNGVCSDINECELTSTCNLNEYCVNKEGSYRCRLCDSQCATCQGPGPSNCTSCTSDNILWSGICITDKQKNELLTTSFRRLGLYVGLLVIAFFIYRFNKNLASMAIVIIAIYIYMYELTSNLNVFVVLYNTFIKK